MRTSILTIAVLLILLGTGGCADSPGADGSRRNTRTATVDYAVDGDTLRVRLQDGDLAYVRLVGRLPRVSSPTLRAPAVAIG